MSTLILSALNIAVMGSLRTEVQVDDKRDAWSGEKKVCAQSPYLRWKLPHQWRGEGDPIIADAPRVNQCRLNEHSGHQGPGTELASPFAPLLDLRARDLPANRRGTPKTIHGAERRLELVELM